MHIGTTLRARREALGHSLRAVATEVGVDVAYLSRVERGIVPPSESLLTQLALALDLPTEELLLLDGRIPSEWQGPIRSAPGTAADLISHALRELCSPKPPRYPSVMTFAGTRAIETEQFPFEYLSDVAESESWRKEINRPIYHLHKWWAQRLGSVFRGILLGAFSPKGSDVMEVFYQPARLPGAVVFDPFMGSGTTVGEALKLGARAIGRDINPVAHFSVRNALRVHSLPEVRRVFQRVIGAARQELLPFYASEVDGEQVTIQYYFWVKHVPCPECSEQVDLFNSFVFSRHAYAKKNPAAKVVCPSCGFVNDRRYDTVETDCDHCGSTFDASRGPAHGVAATCPTCGGTFRVVDAVRRVGGPPQERMFAKVWLDPQGRRRYAATDASDLAVLTAAAAALQREPGNMPEVPIVAGYNTKQVLNYGYSHWHQMFNARQLLVLGRLGRDLASIPDVAVRDLLFCAFSGLLEFNNMFTSFKGEGTGAVRHMFSHHILKPERTPFETNPLSEGGSGTFQGLFERRVVRAIRYQQDPFELMPAPGRRRTATKVHGLGQSIGTESAETYEEFAGGKDLYLSVGNSGATDIGDESVDAIVTDPPFFDNVHYSELADFFWVWQRHFHEEASSQRVTTRSEHEVQHGDEMEFASRLGSVWCECRRVLTPHGLLVFTYHHSRKEGWRSLLSALGQGDFGVVACHPVKAELSVASPKTQAKSPIDLDIILVCRKREAASVTVPSELHDLQEEAQAVAARQIARFNRVGRQLSKNDVLITIAAQLLRQLSWRTNLAQAVDSLEGSAAFIDQATEVLWEGQVLQEPAADGPAQRELALR